MKQLFSVLSTLLHIGVLIFGLYFLWGKNYQMATLMFAIAAATK